MRIALLGQAAFAEKALEVLVKHGDEIVGVFAPPDPPNGRPDPLAAKARELGLPLSQPKTFKSDAAFDKFRALDADLAILAFVTLIVPERILYLPRHHSICFHPSLLPRHRGGSAINWTIMMGDSETGITWFWPDQGIDTGPILLQKKVPLGPNETTGSIYFNALFPLGIEAMIESVDLIGKGTPPRNAQDESRATYEPLCRDEHARLDFSKPARELFNVIRGCDPQPGAWAELDGKRVRLYDASLDNSRPGERAGTIIRSSTEGLSVALSDATVIAKRVRIDPSPKKLSPAELPALKSGARLT